MSNRDLILILKFRNDARAALARAGVDLNKLGRDAQVAQAQVTHLNRGLAAMGVSLRGLLAGFSLGVLTRGLLDTITTFESLRARLVTVEGSLDAAGAAFARLQSFAADTPFQLTEVIDAFTTLKARGIDPTTEVLTALGNLAAASGQDLSRAIEAAAQASVGSFESLRNGFGITLRAIEGDTTKLRLSFRGTTIEIGRDADSIIAALVKIGTTDFAGGMERQMATVRGAVSNLKDAIAAFADQIGQAGLAQEVNAAARALTEFVKTNPEAARSIGRTLGDAVRLAGETFGALTRNIDLVGAALAAFLAARYIPRVIESLIALRVAVTALVGSGVVLGGPLGLLAAALAAMGWLIWRDRVNDAAAALDRYREITEESTKALTAQTTAIQTGTQADREAARQFRDTLRARLEDARATRAQTAAEIDRLQARLQAGEFGRGADAAGRLLAQRRDELAALDREIAEREAGLARLSALAGRIPAQPVPPQPPTLTDEARTQAAKDFEKLKESLDPALRTLREYHDSLKTLDTAIKTQIISQAEYREMLRALNEQLLAAGISTETLRQAGLHDLAIEQTRRDVLAETTTSLVTMLEARRAENRDLAAFLPRQQEYIDKIRAELESLKALDAFEDERRQGQQQRHDIFTRNVQERLHFLNQERDAIIAQSQGLSAVIRDQRRVLADTLQELQRAGLEALLPADIFEVNIEGTVVAIEDISQKWSALILKLQDLRLRDEMGIGEPLTEEEARLKAVLEQAQTLVLAYDDLAEVRRQLEGDAFAGAREGLRLWAEQARNVHAQVADATQSMLTGLADTIVGSLDGSRASFREFANSVIRDLLRILVTQQMLNIAVSAFGGGFLGFGGFGIGPSAGTIINPSAQATVGMAHGDVLTRPTRFPMGPGRWGLAGEAGPEAVMPLTRLSSGDLGVKAEGGAPITINVQGGDVSVQSSTTGRSLDPQGASRLGKLLDTAVQRAVIETVREQQRPGGLLDPMPRM